MIYILVRECVCLFVCRCLCLCVSVCTWVGSQSTASNVSFTLQDLALTKSILVASCVHPLSTEIADTQQHTASRPACLSNKHAIAGWPLGAAEDLDPGPHARQTSSRPGHCSSPAVDSVCHITQYLTKSVLTVLPNLSIR